jgi:hypothetical protein
LPYVTHAYLGLALLPLLLIKLLVVRVFKKYHPALPYLGVILFTAAFTLVGFTGLQRAILWAKGPRITIQQEEGTRNVSTAVGREILHYKCARCHGLKASYVFRKTEDDWRVTVERMAQKDRGLITGCQVDSIVGYLSSEQGSQE